MNHKIALVTYRDQGAYHQISVQNEDDQLLNYLTAKGLHVEKVIWNDTSVQWNAFSLILIKSPWDYFNLISDFYGWLEKLRDLGIPVLNPIDILKWNADKHYLQDIAAAGLKVTPSAFATKSEKIDLQAYFNQFNVDKLIVKPAVSGGSKYTFKVTRDNVAETNEKLNGLLVEEDFIIQPFLNEIEENGEWSFLFFGGKFSHALLKKAKQGDFRVQATFGGTVHPQDAPEELLVKAQQYVDQFAQGCLYARVDGTIVDHEFVLMELELIEPFLFLETFDNSWENYYQALLEKIKNTLRN